MEVRLAGAALGGGALLLIGWRLRRKRRGYALALQGGGAGIIYLTTYAALQLYQLIPTPLAFGLFTGLSLLAGLLALANDARILAFLAGLGAFLAPVLAGGEAGNHVILFSYMGVVNLGLLALAWSRSWRSLTLMGFLFTFGIGTAWGAENYRPELFASVEPFLLFFFLLYVATPILFAARQPRGPAAVLVDEVLLFGAPVAAFSLQALLVAEFERGLGWSALGFGLFYALLTGAMAWRSRAHLRSLTESFAFLAVVFLTITPPAFWDARTTSAIWAVEGAGLVWMGVRQRRLWSRLTGLLVLAGANLAFGLDLLLDLQVQRPVLNAFFAGEILLSGTALFAAYQMHRGRERLARLEQLAIPLVGGWGLLVWYLAGWREIDQFAGQLTYPQALALTFTGLSVVGWQWLADRLSWPLPGWPGRFWLPALFLALAAWADIADSPLSEGGWFAWPVALIGLYWLIRRRERAGVSWVRLEHSGGLALIALLLAWETSWRLEQQGWGDGWRLAAQLTAPALLILLVSQLGRRLPWPVGPNLPTYLSWGLTPVALGALGWSSISTLLAPGNPDPLGYIPLLNPLDLALMLLFLAFFVWLRRLQEHFPEAESRVRLGRWILGIWAWAMTNGAVARAVHHLAGVAFDPLALYRSDLYQTALSIFWGLLALALMFTATRRRVRSVWMAGGLLLAMTVLKLFLVDLANVSTGWRIVSFIGVGILILIVGYLAPAPPEEPEEDQEPPTQGPSTFREEAQAPAPSQGQEQAP